MAKPRGLCDRHRVAYLDQMQHMVAVGGRVPTTLLFGVPAPFPGSPKLLPEPPPVTL